MLKFNCKFIIFFSILLALSLSACGRSTVPESLPDKAQEYSDSVGAESWMEVYPAVLSGDNELNENYLELTEENYLANNEEMIYDNFTVYGGCTLYDANGDSVPELFIRLWLYEGYINIAYTIENGVAKYLGNCELLAVEKASGYLVCFSESYQLNIAYVLEDNVLRDIPGYVDLIFDNDEFLVKLGDNLFRYYASSETMFTEYPIIDEMLYYFQFHDVFNDALIDYDTSVPYFPALSAINELPVGLEEGYLYFTSDNLNLREGPDTNSARITTVPKGTAVKVINFLDGEWVLVEYDGQTGYMKAEFLINILRHYSFRELPGLPDEITEVLSIEQLVKIVGQREDHYAEMFKKVTVRDWLCLSILEIKVVDEIVYMRYDFYEIAESWSLRIGTIAIKKDRNGTPAIISDEVDEAAMDKVKKAMQEWGGEGQDIIIGYWASIYTATDGVEHLSGYYFAEDGTGLLFHSAEGAFPITSYNYTDNKLFLTFLNMYAESTELDYQLQWLSENSLLLDNIQFNRMLMIEATNCMGAYIVTQLDGAVAEIMGYY